MTVVSKVLARCMLLVVLAPTACSIDLSGLDEELCEAFGCGSGGGGSGSGVPDLTIMGTVFVGDSTAAQGQAEVYLLGYPAPPQPLPVNGHGVYMQSFNGEVASAVCGWSARAHLVDGRVSVAVPLFEEPPTPCSGSLDAVDFHFPASVGTGVVFPSLAQPSAF